MPITIKLLRQSGYKVRVIHERDYTTDYSKLDGPVKKLSARGGKTTIEITAPDGTTVFGVAYCSKKDNFNRKIANRIAVGRALDEFIALGKPAVINTSVYYQKFQGQL